jgi:hypothetical protein
MVRGCHIGPPHDAQEYGTDMEFASFGSMVVSIWTPIVGLLWAGGREFRLAGSDGPMVSRNPLSVSTTPTQTKGPRCRLSTTPAFPAQRIVALRSLARANRSRVASRQLDVGQCSRGAEVGEGQQIRCLPPPSTIPFSVVSLLPLRREVPPDRRGEQSPGASSCTWQPLAWVPVTIMVAITSTGRGRRAEADLCPSRGSSGASRLDPSRCVSPILNH